MSYELKNTCSTDYFIVHMAGDYDVAKQYTREYTFKIGSCFELSKVDFIYTGGLESGLSSRVIAYPRFPKDNETLYKEVKEYAEGLAEKLCQKSFTIEGKCNTMYFESTNELHKK